MHRLDDDPLADRVEETLNELVVAHKVVRYLEMPAGDPTPPCINESGRIIVGKQDLDEYLYRLKTDLDRQRSISGDVCYIDPETGEIC